MSQPTAFEISNLVRQWVEHQFGPHARPGRVVIDLIGAPPVTLPILGPGSVAGEPTRAEPTRAEASPAPAANGVAGDEFRSVLWHGKVYGFSPAQAKVVAALWSARDGGSPDVADAELARAGGVSGGKLAELFNGSPAWGTLITEGATRGTHRIAPPSPE